MPDRSRRIENSIRRGENRGAENIPGRSKDNTQMVRPGGVRRGRIRGDTIPDRGALGLAVGLGFHRLNGDFHGKPRRALGAHQSGPVG